MCTLIAIHGRVPGKPLVVAANRDEYLDRPSRGMAVRAIESGHVLAPRDVRAGGTWLGLNARGVFAALTNLRTETPDPARRTRGRVVLEALEARSASEAVERMGQLEEGTYNPFNLFLADENCAHLVVYNERPMLKALAAGVHVVGNVDASGPGNEKVRRIEGEAEAALAAVGHDEGDELLERLAAICRKHDGAGETLRDTCVHVGATYGTRSSILMELGEGLNAGRILQADGPPCETEYQDVSTLLTDLRRPPVTTEAEKPTRAAS